MTLECHIVNDLLPLYTEGLCSGPTAQAVKAHLSSCHVCQAKLKISLEEPPQSSCNGANPPCANGAVKRAVRRVRLAAAAKAMASLVLALALLGGGFLALCQTKGDGIGFTTLVGRHLADKAFSALVEGNLDQAASYFANPAQRTAWKNAVLLLQQEGIALAGYSIDSFGLDDGLDTGRVSLQLSVNGGSQELRLAGVGGAFLVRGRQVQLGSLNQFHIAARSESQTDTKAFIQAQSKIITLLTGLSTWEAG